MTETLGKAGGRTEAVSAGQARALAQWHESAAKSDAASSRKFIYWLCVAIGALSLFFFLYAVAWYALEPNLPPSSSAHDQREVNLVISAIGLVLVGCSALMARARYRYVERQTREMYEMKHAVDERQYALDKVVDDLKLGNLFNLNSAESDEYHAITRAQAAQAFRNAQIAMFIGFTLIAAGIIVVLLPLTPESKIAASVISLVGGSVGGYVNRTFIKEHSLSIFQLNNLFRQPLVQSYLLTAERVALQLNSENERATALRLVVDQSIRAADTAGKAAPEKPEDSEPPAKDSPVADSTQPRRKTSIA